jgi:hypothetical protein
MSGLSVAEEVVGVLLAEVEAYGAVPQETGAFLLSREDAPDELSLVAVPGSQGVRRHRDLFEISGETMAELFERAADEALTIRAQLHSHRRSAFLSRTDLEHGFSVEGFVTCVVPRYADPPREPALWSWWRFERGLWNGCPAPVVTPGACERIDFAGGRSDGR